MSVARPTFDIGSLIGLAEVVGGETLFTRQARRCVAEAEIHDLQGKGLIALNTTLLGVSSDRLETMAKKHFTESNEKVSHAAGLVVGELSSNKFNKFH